MSKKSKLSNPIGDQKKIRKQLKNLTDEDIEALQWYYKMELKPGSFTGGFTVFNNMIPTQSMLERVNVKGLRALDIGGMECAFSVLLDRAGADVEVYDRLDMSDRISLIKEAYKSEFKYHAGKPFHKFAESQAKKKDKGYDFILFSGVLYHVIEPSLFLYYVKSLMKPGGIMVLETSLIPDEQCCMYFNEEGRYYRGSNYYQVSSSWLDYNLRLLGFKIHNMNYVESKKSKDGHDIVRCALLAELTDEPVLRPNDKWGRRELVEDELAEFMRLPKHKAVDLTDRITREGFKKYGVERRELLHKGTQSLNLTKLLKLKKPMPFNARTCVRYLDDELNHITNSSTSEPKSKTKKSTPKKTTKKKVASSKKS